MLVLEWIAERRIAEAVARGDFDNLPGAGKPLDLDGEPLLPEDLRLAYRILKNAGFVPPELETQREIRALEDLIDSLGAEGEDRLAALRKLQLLRLKLAESGRRGTLTAGSDYFGQLLRRL